MDLHHLHSGVIHRWDDRCLSVYTVQAIHNPAFQFAILKTPRIKSRKILYVACPVISVADL